MKFSVRQILASAAGAVIAALIASSFGVTGTIVGVAIGSAAATFGTALVSQSLDRGHQAVKQVAERVPVNTGSPLLRRLGGTRATGADAASSVDARTAPMDVVGSGAGGPSGGPGSGSETRPVTAATDETVQLRSTEATGTEATEEETQRLDADGPATERNAASTMPMRRVATSGRGGGAGSTSSAATTGIVRASSSAAPSLVRRYSWKAIAAAAGIVFVLALLFITAVELISGQPLSDIFGGIGSGTSFGNLFGPSTPAPTSTTTSTTSPGVTSTSAPATSGSTTTTAPTGATSTTTTSAPSTTTTTLTVGGSGTTTTAPAGATSP